MIIVQFRIEVQNELHFDVDYDILKREDANQLEMDIAQKVEALFTKAFLQAGKNAGLNIRSAKVEPVSRADNPPENAPLIECLACGWEGDPADLVNNGCCPECGSDRDIVDYTEGTY